MEGTKSVVSDKRDVQVKLVPFQMTSLNQDFGLARCVYSIICSIQYVPTRGLPYSPMSLYALPPKIRSWTRTIIFIHRVCPWRCQQVDFAHQPRRPDDRTQSTRGRMNERGGGRPRAEGSIKYWVDGSKRYRMCSGSLVLFWGLNKMVRNRRGYRL